MKKPMPQLIEMDRTVTYAQQLEDVDAGPVVLINKFDVPQDEVDEFVAGWAENARYLKHKPGYISAQLHCGIAGSGVFINIAIWESLNAFKRAQEGFRPNISPRVVAAPHVFRRVAVEDVCLA